jgi:hypothetical protein
MKLGTFVRGVVVIGALAGSLGIAVAQQGDKPKEMTPQERAAMEAWMKVATPGEGHKALEPIVGTWDVQMTMWQAPGAPAQVSKGVSEDTWVLGGRFVRESVHSEFNGMPFEGLGYTGYDNFKKQYVGSWMDTMGTMMMTMTGSADSSGKVITATSTMDDVMTGKKITVRQVTRIVDANKHVFEMFGPDPAGNEFKMMEAVYTRK